MLEGRFCLKKWEIALILSLCISLFHSFVFGELSCCAWWGTVYPELTESSACSVSTFSSADGVVIRLRAVEWLAALLQRLR